MRVAIGLVLSMLLASVPAAIAGSNSVDEGIVAWRPYRQSYSHDMGER